jgi:hypothetical protein
MVATLLERSPSQPQLLLADWEAPAGGLSALPRIGRVSFTYRGCDDEHLYGQGCSALELCGQATETCLVAFACGCRARVLRRLLEPR